MVESLNAQEGTLMEKHVNGALENPLFTKFSLHSVFQNTEPTFKRRQDIISVVVLSANLILKVRFHAW